MLTLTIILVIYSFIIVTNQVNKTLAIKAELARVEHETLLLEIEAELIGIVSPEKVAVEATPTPIREMTDVQRIDNLIVSVRDAFAVEPEEEVEVISNPVVLTVAPKATLRTLIQEAVLEAPVMKVEEVVNPDDSKYKGIKTLIGKKLTLPQLTEVITAYGKAVPSVGVTKLRLEVRGLFDNHPEDIFQILKDMNLI